MENDKFKCVSYYKLGDQLQSISEKLKSMKEIIDSVDEYGPSDSEKIHQERDEAISALLELVDGSLNDMEGF